MKERRAGRASDGDGRASEEAGKAAKEAGRGLEAAGMFSESWYGLKGCSEGPMGGGFPRPLTPGYPPLCGTSSFKRL